MIVANYLVRFYLCKTRGYLLRFLKVPILFVCFRFFFTFSPKSAHHPTKEKKTEM